LKKEIVTLGVPQVKPALQTGTYIEPEHWNSLITNPEVLTIDTRNTYETSIGKFQHAIDPNTETFREFPKYAEDNFKHLDKNQKIAMYCTGGIRCEKSTSYLQQLGFNNVYHLKGGILNYLEKIPATESLWQGECFVFDNRVAVDKSIGQGSYDQCHACRNPISAEQKLSDKYKPGTSCPLCFDKLPEKTLKRATERQKQMQIAAKKNIKHIGPYSKSFPLGGKDQG
jgi:UPF0176 protein